MIECIKWNIPLEYNELPCPFMRGKGERSLRITLHSASLTELSGEPMAAITMLREFGHLPEIQILETEPGHYPHIEIGSLETEEDSIPVHIISNGTIQLYTGIWHPKQWPDIARRIVGRSSLDHQDVKDMLDMLIVAQAHQSCRGDILVTSSPLLLENRKDTWLSEANPRTPLEAAQIVGLFLRSRDIYTLKMGPHYQVNFDQGMFYWVLTRHRLPSMWRYFSACEAASKIRDDDIQELGASILNRAVRALEARDAIGTEFYVPQNNNIRDRTMYHFDYLTLVLAGALDAQARVAFRAYQLDGLEERFASFRRDDFQKALRESGAQKLSELSNAQRFKDTLTLLYELRNTIHGAALETTAYRHVSELERTLVTVPQYATRKLLEAAERLGGAEEWGLKPDGMEVRFEPYSYATALVKETLSILDTIAAATDVSGLFQQVQPIPSFSKEAPKDSVFAWAEQIALLA